VRLLGLIALALLLTAACGPGPNDVPPGSFDVFTIELLDLAEGDRVLPGKPLRYQVRYQGTLARDLRFTAVFLHEATGETASQSWSAPPNDTFRVNLKSSWNLEHDFLKRSGRIRVHLEASIQSTRTGSTPWQTRSQSVYVELHPSVSVQIAAPATTSPIPYATPLELQLTGQDLWGDVSLAVVDATTGEAVPELALAVPFDLDTRDVSVSWVLRARALERVGTHPLQVVATFGAAEARSALFDYLVTHTIDEVSILARRTSGTVSPPWSDPLKLPEVSELGLRIRGTQLGGHTYTVNGGAARTASGDELEVMLLVPKTSDFQSGKGVATYDFLVRSGGIERTAAVRVQRWGINHCAWYATDGREYSQSEAVNPDTEVVMKAVLWGFPDTKDYVVFKSPLARFTVWERDPGGRPDELISDSVENNDDKVKSFDGEIKAGQSEAVWKAEYVHEVDPIDFNVNAAEFDFDVQVEDQVCTSGEILVY
jgi:hypothetical protein